MPMRIPHFSPGRSDRARDQVGRAAVTHDGVMWALWFCSVAGAWLITLLVNFVVGSLAFFTESSVKFMDAWLVFFFVLSGYLIPVDLFPRAVRVVVDLLPFRYQIGLPVKEIMTGASTAGRPRLALLLRQWVWVAAMTAATLVLWRRGLRQFAAYGG